MSSALALLRDAGYAGSAEELQSLAVACLTAGFEYREDFDLSGLDRVPEFARLPAHDFDFLSKQTTRVATAPPSTQSRMAPASEPLLPISDAAVKHRCVFASTEDVAGALSQPKEFVLSPTCEAPSAAVKRLASEVDSESTERWVSSVKRQAMLRSIRGKKRRAMLARLRYNRTPS